MSNAVEEAAEEEGIVAQEMLRRCMVVASSRKKKPKINHRWFPRNAKRFFRHEEALHCIRRDYMGIDGDLTTPIFAGSEFASMFRISRPRFQRMLEDFGSSGIPFYSAPFVDCFGKEGASLEARLLLPLKCLSFGVPPKTFTDYFQMSPTLAKDCCNNFNAKLTTLYRKEYLRLPTKEDLHSINRLHRKVHGVNGMFGSLDCMHTYWNKCPKAWQGSFKGKGDKPSIVLEGICDHNLWLWHASYGYAGTLNDINIMNLSPFFENLLNGVFESLEDEVCPYTIAGEVFEKMYLLVDGIYPRYSRFVKSMKEPTTREEKAMTKFQEAARKDIERAFGVLQGKFQAMARPIVLMDLQRISNLCSCCIILHNMCVSDRIMEGDVRARYDPANKVSPEQEEDTQHSEEFKSQKKRAKAVIGIRNADPCVQKLLRRKERWTDMTDLEEYGRLHAAIMRLKAS